MDRGRRSAYGAIALGPHMVGVDLDTNRDEASSIYVRVRTKRSECLGECNRGATVEQPKRLLSPRIYRHGPDDPRGGQFGDLDSQSILEAAAVERIEPGERVSMLGHAES